MLVLSRGQNESVMIGECIEITVSEVKGKKVKLGIKAPVHIPVHRKEVYEQLHSNAQQSPVRKEK